MARRDSLVETIDLGEEANLRALMRDIQKKEYGKEFFERFYPSGDKDIEVVSHVTGKPANIQQILYVNWFEKTFLNFDNFKRLRRPDIIYDEPEIIPLYLRLMLSYQRKSRLEGIKAMIGDATERARSIFRLQPKG